MGQNTFQQPQPLESLNRLVVDKIWLQQAVAEMNQQIGFHRDVKATALQSREMILAEGVSPDDNLFSCGILASRDEE